MEHTPSPEVISLARAVIVMREAQSAYFRSRTSFNLRRAKELEAQVDQLCRSIVVTDQPSPATIELFRSHPDHA